ncbi:transmembrane protein 17B-like [Mizuhopecten yessoensis]|uniref:Transmembrane protein 17B n=1 Tax=Mizuhopecten yessoensis TaxID=6573 RepID=A0A210Q813_MIZYE|nr:transmembrane protein 17B-like [Mizuhopecten yessoensis]OWF44819.1 Transmembrane protein 17B [Mizuhopecten yessoensis]
MEATLRRTVTNFTDVLFPVSKNAQDPNQHQILKTGNEYVSNLPLQMALYFNMFFMPFWLTSILVCFEIKYTRLSILYVIVLIAIYFVYTLIEIIRLYIGYTGNLTERVPELAGSWLLTLLIQFPLILLLTFNDDAVLLPLERAVHIIEALFVLFEVVCGYFAIRTMVNYQVTKFHLRQFTDLEQLPGEEVHWHDGYDSYHQNLLT